MSYQKPKVLAENKKNGLYLIPCAPVVPTKDSMIFCKSLPSWFYLIFFIDLLESFNFYIDKVKNLHSSNILNYYCVLF